jgi:hypothetical protein
LWTLVREQLPIDVQNRASELMTKNSKNQLNQDEQLELETLVHRADRLMLRKAEVATILKQRGYTFSQRDFKPRDE